MDQQRQIRKWLKTVIADDAERVFKAQSSVYSDNVASLSGSTPNQYKTLTKTILPRVALYKALKADEKLSERAYELTHKYMIEIIGMQKHKSTRVLEIIPGFYRISHMGLQTNEELRTLAERIHLIETEIDE